MYELFFYENEKGECLVDEFLDHLPEKILGKAHKWLEKLEQEGPNLPRPYADVLKGKIRELRLIFGSNHYRLLYFFHEKKIVLTHGFVKKTDQVPPREIEKADRIRLDFLKRLERGEIKL